MNVKRNLILLIILSLMSGHSAAVQMGQNSLGQVLIYPYYTVNNNLNTLYSIVNTTEQPKALRIRFLEGAMARDVLSFSIYLDAFDVWTGVLIPTLSTLPGHNNEPSGLHRTFDGSCAPYLNKNDQQFLPFVLDLNPTNNNLKRSREGHIEVIEMGVLTGEGAAAVAHNFNGEPQGCFLIQNDWDDSEWSLGELDDPAGGLSGSATLVNVFEGVSFTYDAIALENFWDQAGLHTEPGSELPNLSSGLPQSKVLLTTGELAVSDWSTGYEAVSAVLMQAKLFNEYAYDSSVNGQSEWVVTFPTKTFHVTGDDTTLAPFEHVWDGSQSCDHFKMDIWDRQAQYKTVPYACPERPCGPVINPKFCFSSNVIEFTAPEAELSQTSGVLGSNNLFNFPNFVSPSATENGWVSIEFNGPRTLTPESGTGFVGLPMVGFMVQQFTNAAAQEGLLAQYGGLFLHKGLVETDENSGD